MAEVESAVRIPTPPPQSPTPPGSPAEQPQTNGLKRKHPASRSPTPDRYRPVQRNVNLDDERDGIRARKLAKAKDTKPMTEEEKNAQAKKDFLSLRSGGAYIPPARLRAMQASITQDKKSEDFQRLAHDARKKSINGLVNKLNIGNIKAICEESFNEDLIKARGLLCQSLLKAQAASLSFTSVYAAYVTVITSKLPIIGELLQNRLVNRWAKAFKRNDKAVCVSSTHFLAHLCNQDVVSYIVLANMLQMLLEKPTDDSVEIAVNLMRELGQHLEESNMPIANLLYDRLRQILQESDLEKRTLYAIEVLFQIRRDRYANNPAIPEGLDIVPDEDKVTLEAVPPDQFLKTDPQTSLNIFKYDADYESNEASWKKMRDEIFGEGSDGEDESGSEAGSESESEDESDAEAHAQDVKDMTADELVQLRRRIYLTITSSSAFEEATHKLMKIPLPVGKEQELPQMLVETCSQRPTYEKFFGFIGQRLSEIRRDMREQFEQAFTHYYESIHRYDNNRLRAIAQFFAHLLGTEAIGWYVFQCVIMTEEDTTASSRIFIKILFEGLVEEMGMKKLQAKTTDAHLRPYYNGIFPMDSQKNTRFAINYFTSIKMGALTEEMRAALVNMPKAPAPALPATNGRRSPIARVDVHFPIHPLARAALDPAPSTTISLRFATDAVVRPLEDAISPLPSRLLALAPRHTHDHVHLYRDAVNEV
ncbi:MAG: hypothetical protein Q9162_000119 [Coniocarpon cinnabarinum]